MPMACFAAADYQQGLKSKTKSKSKSKSEAKTKTAAAAAAEAEEIDDDPDYMLFLKHLHPNVTGRSYFLDMISTSTPTPRRGKEKEKRGATTSTNSIYIRYEDESSFYNKENDDEMSSLANWTAILDPRNPSVDRDYRDFLKHLKPQPDGSVLLHLDNDVLIHYPEEEEEADPEEEEEAAADPEEEEEEEEEAADPEEEEEEALARNEEYKQKISSSSSPSLGKDLQSHNPSPRLSKFSGSEALSFSSFKSRLMKNLNRPFDQREYNRLMRSATVRKPMVKLKHLRTVDVPYETGKMSHSYFDHFPDFARKVSSADHLRGLKLLRGFFFWLMNLDHEGAYRPWVSTP